VSSCNSRNVVWTPVDQMLYLKCLDTFIVICETQNKINIMEGNTDKIHITIRRNLQLKYIKYM